MSETEVRITGGCQCGAVRYALHAVPTNPHICHCRMCQKAFGSFFAPLARRAARQVRADARRAGVFRSSEPTERGFCRDCGTPLTFRYLDKDRINISLGSLDDPAQIPPLHQYGVEGRLPWFDKLVALPGETTTEEDDPDLAGRIAATNHQHPDHDTAAWPPAGSGPE